MTWRDNLRAASSEDGFIIAGGSGASMIPQNTNWHDNYMNSFTEDGIKIANLKEPVEQVESLPATGKEGELCYVTGDNPGMYFYDGDEWVAVGGGGGGVTPEQLDERVKQMAGAPTTSTVGVVGQLLEDTTNGKLYQCTAVNSSAGVDATAGLTSQLSSITFTISDLSKLNSKISSTATLSAGSYMIRKGASLAYYISNINDSTSLGSLGNIAPTAFTNVLGVTPAPAGTWTQAAGHLANGAAVFSFTLVNGGQVSYTWTEVVMSDFVGTNGTAVGAHGLVPAPATTDAGKFLKADGTWDTAGGGGPTVVQTIGTSQTDVMSQNAVSSMIFADPNYGTMVNIGSYTNSGTACVVVGSSSSASYYGVALGFNAQAPYNGDIALGAESGSNCIDAGIVDVGTGSSSFGYSGNSNYRLITGVHDAQGAHDAVTLGQLSSLVTLINTLLNTNIVISNGIISDGNNANNTPEEPGIPDDPSTPDDPSVPDDPSDPSDPGDEPGPDEPAPDDAEAPMEG